MGQVVGRGSEWAFRQRLHVKEQEKNPLVEGIGLAQGCVITPYKQVNWNFSRLNALIKSALRELVYDAIKRKYYLIGECGNAGYRQVPSVQLGE